MHKIFVLLLLVVSSIPGAYSQAKTNYHLYYFNNNAGVTDTTAREILPPLYRNYSNRDDLYWVLVQNDTSSVLFNTANGVQNQYKRISPYAASLEDGHYMHIQQYQGPSLLIHPQTGNTIELGRAYTDGFQRENNYLFAYYYISDSAIRNYKSRRVDVLDMRNKMQPLVTGAYASVQQLYKTGTEQKDENTRVAFDAVLFSLYNQHQLYDKDMKLVKNFTSQKMSSQDLAQTCSRILQYIVSTTYKQLPSQVVEAAVAVLDASPPQQLPSARLQSKKTDDSTTVVYLERKNNDSLLLFTTTANRVYADNNSVNIYQVNDKFIKTAEASFEVDLTTGRCLFPVVYWKSLHMKPIQ